MIGKKAISVLLLFVFMIRAEVNPVHTSRNSFLVSLLQQNNPYNQQAAHVKTTAALSPEERSFQYKRFPIVKACVERIVGTSLEDHQIPRIAISGSGGGYRAMLSLLGFLEGSQASDVLDAVSYVGGVSGSTWCIMPWICYGRSVGNFKRMLVPTLHNGLLGLSGQRDINDLIIHLLRKWIFNQPLSLVDLYGAVLAHNLLFYYPNAGLHQTLSMRIKNGMFPCPIGCALGGDNKQAYAWFEFSPFEVGSPELNAYIPTWAFGRKFNQGVSRDYAPEQSLGYLLGIFGSAFSECGYNDLYRMMLNRLREKNNPILLKIAERLGHSLNTNHKDVGGAKIHNFMYGLPQNTLSNEHELTMIDAGITFDEAQGVGANIPVLPFLREGRDIDILFIMDASGELDNAPSLHYAVEYAKKCGYAMPDIDYARAGSEVISVFGNLNDGQGPIIIYMPNIKNDAYSSTFDPRICAQHGHCSMFNFAYTQQQAEELSGLVSFNVQQQKDRIYNVIRDFVSKKTNI